MATFVIGQAISTTVPFITVDAGLPVGRHRFQLVVVTGDRRASKPDVADVDVIQRLPIPGTLTTGIVTSRAVEGGTISGGTSTGTVSPTITTTTTRTIIRPDGE